MVVGGGGGGNFFSGGNSDFGGRIYILKLAFSDDEVLSCILQNALTCSLKLYSRKPPYK